MNEKVEQNKKIAKKYKFIRKVDVALYAYNLCWYILEEYKDLLNLNETQLDELFLQIYLIWPHYKKTHSQLLKKVVINYER